MAIGFSDSPEKAGSGVNLQYDWEKPDRHYFYRLASKYKKFSYSLTVPKSLQINQKVVKKVRKNSCERQVFGKLPIRST